MFGIPPGTGTTSKQKLLRAVDAALLATLCVAPCFMGGRHDLGRFVYISSVVALALLWMWRQCLSSKSRWRSTGAEWLVLLVLGLIILQIAPLPQNWLYWLSPQHKTSLPLWDRATDSSEFLGIWSQISLMPVATRGALAMAAAHALLFFTVAQRIRHVEDTERLLRIVAIATVFMATLGLIQYFVGNGKFLWVYQHPSRGHHVRSERRFRQCQSLCPFLSPGCGPLGLVADACVERQFFRSTPDQLGKARSVENWQLVLS